MAAHDLQGPTRHILTHTHILQEELVGLGGEDVKRTVDVIVNQSIQMRKFILDLLEFCTAGRDSLDRTEVDTKLLVETTLESLKEDGEFGLIDVEVGALPIVQADEINLSHVLINLISNAAKFKKSEGTHQIAINCTVDENADV